MHKTILDTLAKRAPRFKDEDESCLNREIKRTVSKIKNKKPAKNRIKSSRGGLTSLGARGVFLKEGDIYSRRVIIKASYILSKNENARARIRHHLHYAGRNTLEEGKKSQELYGHEESIIDVKDKLNEFEKAPHMFNIIISPEDGDKVQLKDFTRDFVRTVETDLRTKLDWVAGNHYDTNEPHVHLLIKGLDDKGKKLLMTRDYISCGLRVRASQTITKKLGLRDWEDVIQSLKLDAIKSKRCSLDNIIIKNAHEGSITLSKLNHDTLNDLPKGLIEKRLAFLESKELAHKTGADSWQLRDGYIEELKKIDRSASIIEKLSGNMRVNKEECEILSVKNLEDRTIKGHVVERGYINEIDENEYLLVKTKEKSFIYVELEKYSEKAPAKAGEFIRIDSTKPFSGPKASDYSINTLARDNGGIYDAKLHERVAEKNLKLPPGVSASEYAQVHVKRLEVLARKGLVEKTSEGRFVVSKDYLEKLTLESQRSKEGHKPHIKITRLSAARLAKTKLARTLKQ